MTPIEYVEHVQENLAFPSTGVGCPDPSRILYATEEQCARLAAAHDDYCKLVAHILGVNLLEVRVSDRIDYVVDSEGGLAD